MTASSNGNHHNRDVRTAPLWPVARALSIARRNLGRTVGSGAPVRYPPRPALASSRKRTPAPRLGVWLFGAYGGLATTLVVGARAIARGLAPAHGLMTETDVARGIELQPIDGLVFGGHEIRTGDYAAQAAEIQQRTATFPHPLLARLRADLAAASRNVVPGVLPNPGKAIAALADARPKRPPKLRAQVEQVQADLQAFARRHRLDRIVCVNLTSTEPALRPHAAHASLAAFDRALDRDLVRAVRPSALYAYAAASLGLPLIHFTPSNSAFLPAIRELFAATGAPYMGSDGKTGETLVKSALAPMFKYRNLRVLTWQGYNILGDRDGRVLAERENKLTKVGSKDALLPSILGYPLHTHVGIDYVPSLHDLKTAWDFVHFEGFLGFRMALQFVWQGCDSILAAPLVLDMVRLADLAARRGESGPMPQLACFFKQPLDGAEHDLHRQWHTLVDYLDRVRRTGGR
ncbi:MAG: inositol-3-phosphate synthase [Planctomycetes bacterium]|nr:inositol-3-phosphate synthase [Planctomycetota bacterium]